MNEYLLTYLNVWSKILSVEFIYIKLSIKYLKHILNNYTSKTTKTRNWKLKQVKYHGRKQNFEFIYIYFMRKWIGIYQFWHGLFNKLIFLLILKIRDVHVYQTKFGICKRHSQWKTSMEYELEHDVKNNFFSYYCYVGGKISIS